MLKTISFRIVVTCFIYGCFFASQAIAQAILSYPASFNILSINGSSFSARGVNNNYPTRRDISLHWGKNKIALIYKEKFHEKKDQEPKSIESRIIVLELYIPMDGNYKIKYTKPMTLKAALSFTKNPIISIVDNQGKHINTVLKFSSATQTNILNAETSLIALNAGTINIISEKQPADKSRQEDNVQNSSDPTEQLLYWWHKANKQQRQAFLEKADLKTETNIK